MKHEIERQNDECTVCTCGRRFYQEYLECDKYWRFIDHKKIAEHRDAAKERLAKRDRSELLKKWSGRLGYISGTTGNQASGIPIWERKIENYFILCYFFEPIFGGGVPRDEVFAVIEEMSDGSLKPIILDIEIDIISDGVIRKMEIREKKFIISYERKTNYSGMEIIKEVFDLTKKHDVLIF